MHKSNATGQGGMITPSVDQLQAAIDLLRRPIQDRPREVYTDLGGITLVDDSGGEPIERFEDATALLYFLRWIDQQRQARHTARQAAIKRASIELVKGDRRHAK